MPSARAVRLAALVAVCAVAVCGVAGCGGQSVAGGPSSAPPTPVGGTGTETSPASGTSDASGAATTSAGAGSVQVGRTVYVSALEVRVDRVAMDGRGNVTVDGAMVNGNVADNAPLAIMVYTPVDLEFEGGLRARVSTNAPPTPVGARSPFRWTAYVDPAQARDLAAAALVFGSSDSNQSRLPLGEGNLVTVAPVRRIGVGTTVANSESTAKVTESVYRTAYSAGAAGVRRLDLKVAIAGTAPSSYLCGTEYFTLTLPDGSRVRATAPEDASNISAVCKEGFGTTGWLSFPVPAGTRGKATLSMSMYAAEGRPGTATLVLP